MNGQAIRERTHAVLVWVLAMACCLAPAVLVRAGSAPAEQLLDTKQNKPCDDTREKTSSPAGASSSAQHALSRVPQSAYADNANGVR